MLADLQNKFLNYIFDNNDEIIKHLKHNQKENFERLQIYQNNILSNLNNTLKATYPFTLKTIGEKRFFQMSKDYISKYKSLNGNLDNYGNKLSFFLKRYNPLYNYPYLPDLAKIEWLKNITFDYKDEIHIEIEALLKIKPSKYHLLKLKLNNSSSLIKSSYTLTPLFTSNNYTPCKKRSYILLFRKDFFIRIEEISKSEWHFIKCLKKNLILQDAVEIASKHDANFNLNNILQKLFLNKLISNVQI